MPTAADTGSASVDSMLADAIAKMDALTKRMDALEVGEKKIIKGDDDDDKKSKSDSKAASSRGDDDDDDDKKSDGISAPKNKILDDEKGASKDDAGFPPAKSLKKDDDGELEIKHGKGKDDSAKKADAKKADAKKADDDDDDRKKDDAFPPKKAKDDDDDDDKKKDDAVKADGVADLRKQIANQQSIIERLQAFMKPKSDDEHVAFADAQARADAVFSGFGERAPRPLEGEALFDYRKRLATRLKKYSKTWGGVKLSELPESAFKIAEDTVYNDAISAAANPVDLKAGELRMVTKVDPTTGVRSNVFYGSESFVKSMGRPGRRVQSFRTLGSQ
jgi:hypothetical protein